VPLDGSSRLDSRLRSNPSQWLVAESQEEHSVVGSRNRHGEEALPHDESACGSRVWLTHGDDAVSNLLAEVQRSSVGRGNLAVVEPWWLETLAAVEDEWEVAL
jgi:hypothetical protein